MIIYIKNKITCATPYLNQLDNKCEFCGNDMGNENRWELLGGCNNNNHSINICCIKCASIITNEINQYEMTCSCGCGSMARPSFHNSLTYDALNERRLKFPLKENEVKSFANEIAYKIMHK